MVDKTARCHLKPRGFTLVEVAVAIVLLGVGVTAMMQLTAACAFQNRAASEITSAATLAEQVREMLADLPLNDPTFGSTTFGAEAGETLTTFDDVDDFDGQIFSPPRDASRAPLDAFGGYSQSILINPVSASQLGGSALAKNAYTGTVRLTININRLDPQTGVPRVIYTINCIRVEE